MYWICAVAAFVSREKYCFDGLREGISSELHNRAPHPPPLSNNNTSPSLYADVSTQPIVVLGPQLLFKE